MFRLIALLCFAVLAALPMQASVTHTVKFGQGPVVLVWQDGQMVGQGEAVALDGEIAPALNAEWIGSGVLEPVSFDATSQKPRIETITVASNTPLTLRFEGQPTDGRVGVRLVSKGSAAQYRGPQMIERNYTLGDDPILLTIPARTAARPGSVAQQTLTFEVIRTGDAANASLILEAVQ